ncbi:hypothetical protein Focb16_v002492 [Fusarium oxysporum f. sp. cubense]|uniref:Uncharacterized protein n=1 Tax=Fusarium oxysporum f. sp. cubense TaxID=61366 RepID=A0A559L5A1_FUSOC|nr:hypothetical protein Focb16_v002492 [Fusarium oxysporum f. sp. cubense]
MNQRKATYTICCIPTLTNTHNVITYLFVPFCLFEPCRFVVPDLVLVRRRGGLNNFRVLDQSQPDPVNTPDLPQSSRTFRVAAFVFHLGMSMLESRRGREALVMLISDAWRASDRRAQKTFIPKSNFQTDLNEARRFVDTFLAKCRAEPPNIIISDRITGEGLAQRVDWRSILGSQIGDYNPKWAAMFRLNKTVVDSAVNAAELRDVEALQKILFLLSISVAHELVHMLMGFMFGDSERLTPPVINHPPGTPRGPRAGEFGRYWEAKFFGCVVEAHHDPRDPRGSNQAGIFFGTLDGRRSFPMQHQTIMRYVQLDFTVPIYSSNIATSRISAGAVAMQDIRRPSRFPDVGGDLTPYFEMINSLPRQRVSRDGLEEIMHMAMRPEFVRPVSVRV